MALTKPETEDRPSTSSWAGLSDLSVSVLLGVRDDALAKLDRLKAHVPGIFDKDLRLHHLSRSGAREAIEEPLITGLTEEQRETAAAVFRYLVTPSE